LRRFLHTERTRFLLAQNMWISLEINSYVFAIINKLIYTAFSTFGNFALLVVYISSLAVTCTQSNVNQEVDPDTSSRRTKRCHYVYLKLRHPLHTRLAVASQIVLEFPNLIHPKPQARHSSVASPFRR